MRNPVTTLFRLQVFRIPLLNSIAFRGGFRGGPGGPGPPFQKMGREKRGKGEKKGRGRGKEEEEREEEGTETERMGGRLLISAILILGSSFNWPLMYDIPTLLFLYAMAIVQFVVISVTLRRCHAVASGGAHNFSRCRHFKASRQIDVATCQRPSVMTESVGNLGEEREAEAYGAQFDFGGCNDLHGKRNQNFSRASRVFNMVLYISYHL